MASPLIDQFTIRNFGPIKQATLEVGALHALIGPNDSGKSMTLRAIERIVHAVGGAPTVHALTFTPGPDWGWSFRLAFDQMTVSYDPGIYFRVNGTVDSLGALRGSGRIRSTKTLRLDPDALRQLAPLLYEGEPFDFMDERGKGLGRLIDGLFARDPSAHQRLGDRLRQMFPNVQGFRMFTEGGGRAVGVKLHDGTEVRPEHMSEGMLYFLAFAVLEYIDKPSLLLVEEPENGLHPARIKEVVQMLREISKTTQVLLATHSPLVVNELQADEVTVVTRTASDGTAFTRMDRVPNFKERSSAWSLGELWIALCDGVTEEALLAPKRAAG